MKKYKLAHLVVIALICFVGPNSALRSQCFTCDNAPVGTIFCDDFESPDPLSDRYFESGGDFYNEVYVGRDSSRGMRAIWNQGDVGAGGFKKSFGRTPGSYIGKHSVNPNEHYDEIYWRIDVRMQPGWQGGGPDKLSRAMTLANNNWAQGMIAHIWSAGSGVNNAFLGMDPASGIDVNGNLVSTSYNDFNNLRWLGFKKGDIEMFSTANSGKWYCVEAHAKLNTPGEKDGIFEFWINDTLQNGSYDLNWHSTWNNDPSNFGINAIFIENYWNNGSPVTQERYMDNFVISTERIKCKCLTTTSQENEWMDAIEIYPNPAYDHLKIKVDNIGSLEGFTLELFDINSRSVYNSGIIWSTISSHDLQSVPTGIYMYKLTSLNGIVKVGKVNVFKD